MTERKNNNRLRRIAPSKTEIMRAGLDQKHKEKAMQANRWASERRKHARSRIGATAMVLRDGVVQGEYLVENLCAGGALLACGGRVPTLAQHLQIVLRMPRRPALTLKAQVVRQESRRTGETFIALEFVHVPMWMEDVIQKAVVYSLERKELVGGPSVLVVDDCQNVRKTLARQLSELGLRSILAAAALDAMRILDEMLVAPDTALVDLFLGTADGLEICDYLIEEHPGIRRVLMSGHVRPTQLELAIASGRAHAVLHKPWDREELCEVLAA